MERTGDQDDRGSIDEPRFQSTLNEFDALPSDGWHYAINGVEYGPVTKEQARSGVQAAPYGAEVLVWHPTMADWAEARETPLLVRTVTPPALPVAEQPRRSFGSALFSFRGRMARRPYLLWSCLVTGVYVAIVMVILLAAQLDLNAPDAIAIRLVGAMPFVWCLLALTTKRLHDLDRSAWHLLWIVPVMGAPNLPVDGSGRLIPTIASLAVELWLLCRRGTVGANRFGPDPLGGTIAATRSGVHGSATPPSRRRGISWALAFVALAVLAGGAIYEVADLGGAPACGDPGVVDKVQAIAGNKINTFANSLLLGEPVTYSVRDVRTISNDEPLNGRTCAATVVMSTKSGRLEQLGTNSQPVTYTVQMVDNQAGRYVVTVTQ